MAKAAKDDSKAGPEGAKKKAVAKYLLAIDYAKQREKGYLKKGAELWDMYQAGKKSDSKNQSKSKPSFNILWSNTRTLKPAIYARAPMPDVRRRFTEKSPVGKVTAEAIERALSYTIDTSDYNCCMSDAVLDMLIPGRGLTRVKYVPTFETVTPDPITIPPEIEGEAETIEQEEPYERLIDEAVEFEHVQYNMVHFGPGKRMSDVTWIAFEHHLEKEDAIEEFPEMKKEIKAMSADVSLDYKPNEESEDYDPDTAAEVIERIRIYEIWDKKKKKVCFVAPAYKDKPLKIEDDPLGLEHFFPVPRATYANPVTVTTVPTALYEEYEDQAKELDLVSKRITSLANQLKLRGGYDATLKEAQLMLKTVNDGDMIAFKDMTKIMENGGLEKAIMFMPLDMIAKALAGLIQHREQIKQVIYEITGISDILRGTTQASETLGAQQMKANFGSIRLQDMQAEVQRYARDTLEIAAEIIAEHFTIETLRDISGLELVSEQDKQAAQVKIAQHQAAMQMQQQQQAQSMPGQAPQPQPQMPPPTEQDQEDAKGVTWEEVEALLENERLRKFRIDIETDSTIQPDADMEQKNIVELLGAMTNFLTAMAPAVQSGAIPIDTVKAMLLVAVRRFKAGRQIEEEIEKITAPTGPMPGANGAAPRAGADPKEIAVKERKVGLDEKKAIGEFINKQEELGIRKFEAENSAVNENRDFRASQEQGANYNA